MINFRSPRILGAAVLAATLCVTGLAVSTPTTQASGSLSPAKLGMYVGFDRGDRFAEMERSLDLPIKWVLTMADKRSPSQMMSSAWGQLAKPDAYLPGVSDRVNLVMSVPVGFGSGGLFNRAGGRETVRRNLLAVASGQHDSAYQRVARYLIDAGYDDAVLRLGHEFDGTYEPYSARENNDAYIAAYRHVHDLFEKESSRFKFEWTSMRAYFRQHGPPAYPGDRYVDIVGLDIYYREPGPISDRVWTDQYLSVLTAHRDFAASRGKPVAYSEWGRAKADDGRFVSLMHGWFSSLADLGPGRLVYQSYFNETWADYDLGKLPAVRRAYIDLFGRNGAPSQTTPSPPAQAPAAPTTQPAPPPTGTVAPPAAPPAPPAAPAAPSLAPAERLALGSGAATSPGTALTPTVTVTPSATSLALEWTHPEQARANVRYRTIGSTTWQWVPNGGRNQQFTGLAPDTAYEVQVRMHLRDRWQGWTTVQVKTPGVASSGPAAIVADVAQAAAAAAAPTDSSMTLVSRPRALELTWFQPGDGRRNVRYRAVGSSRWTWVPNGAWNQVISGLAANTNYEVQARVLADGGWQSWVTATATTD